MNLEPEQDALFGIEGPDDDGCAWIRRPAETIGAKTWVHGTGWRRCCLSGLDRSIIRRRYDWRT